MAQTKTIDITPARIKLPVIEVSQFDVGRPIIIHMKDGAEWYDLTGLTVKLQGTKPSGFGYSVTGVVSGHDVTFTTTYDMTSEAGFIASEVSIIDGTDVIGSQNIMLHVEESPHVPEVVDGSAERIMPEMRELVDRAEAAAEVLLDCSAIATTLPAGSSATASYDVDNGVFHFGIPRGNKGETGDTGVGISSITKTGTSGLVDTYTITYTDSSTSTFTVTNGDDGDDGVGISSITKTGTSGLVDTYTITYTNGNTTTFTVTNGQNGTGSVSDVLQNGVSVLDGNVAKVTVPTATSDLTNDSGFVADSNYVHTDNNFTATEKDKLAGIASGAEVNVQANWNETSSSSDAYIKNKPTIPKVSSVTVSLTVANWSNNSQTVSVTGVTANNNVIVSPAPASIDNYVAAGIKCTAQSTNSLTFTCTTTPSSAISVNVVILS